MKQKLFTRLGRSSLLMLLTILCLGFSTQAWAWDYDVHVVPAELWGADWNDSKICKVLYKTNNGYTQYIKTMDNTGRKRNGKSIYKINIDQLTSEGVNFLEFQRFSGGSGEAYYTGVPSWWTKDGFAGKIFIGYIDNNHKWISYECDPVANYVYIKYQLNGTEKEYTFQGTGMTDPLNNVTISSNFTITGIWFNYSKHNGNVCGGSLGYNINSTGDQSYEPSWSWNQGGTEFYNSSCSCPIATSTEASGSYTISMWWKMRGGYAGNTSDCSKNWYLSNGGGNYNWTYKVLPPDVSNFQVQATGTKGGDGSENNPYLIAYDTDLTLTVSGDKAHSDANSSFQVKFGSDEYSATTSKTISGIKNITKQSIVIKAKHYNSSASLSSANESTTTIYYIVPKTALTLDKNNSDASGTSDGSGNVNLGSASFSPTQPSRVGYTNKGYYKTSECVDAEYISAAGGGLQASTDYTDANKKWTYTGSTLTLYTKWDPKDYIVTLDYNNGSGTTVNKNVTYDSNKNLTQVTSNPLPTKTGQDFTGYWTNNDGTGTQLVDNTGYFLNEVTGYIKTGKLWGYPDNLTIYAGWTNSTYNIIYREANGSAFTDWGTVTGYPTSHTYNTATPLVSPDNKTGYTFGGWYTTSSCEGDAVTTLGATAYTANITLYAKWVAHTTSLKLHALEGNATVFKTVTATYDATFDNTQMAQADTMRTGYYFEKFVSAAADDCGDSKSARNIIQPIIDNNKKILVFGYNQSCFTNTSRKWIRDIAELHIYARWIARQYKITLDNNGADLAIGTESVTATFDANTNIKDKITLPQKTNKVFAGYYIDQACTATQLIDAGGNFLAGVSDATNTYTDSNKKWKYPNTLTLYAKWIDRTPVTITFGVTNGTTEDATGAKTFTATVGGVTKTSPAVLYSGDVIEFGYTPQVGTYISGSNGWASGGWYSDANIQGAQQYQAGNNKYTYTVGASDANVYLYAKLVTNTFSIAVADGQSAMGSVTAAQGTAGPSVSQAIEATANTGYHFTEWTQTGDNFVFVSPKTAADAQSVVALKNQASQTITANFAVNTFKVRFNKNNNDATGEMSDQDFTYFVAQNLTANAFQLTGYDFAGWATFEEGDVVYNDQANVSNLTDTHEGIVNLYAKWTLHDYTVSFSAGTGGSITIPATSTKEDVHYNEAFEIEATPNTGYSFNNWTCNPIGAFSFEGEQTAVNANAPRRTTNNTPAITTASASTSGTTAKLVDVSDVSNLSITANFTENTYSITFDANGGTGTMDAQTNLGCATAQTLNANAFVRTGYDFVGWSTVKDGDKVYDNQGTVAALTKTENNSTLELFAKWTKHDYTVTMSVVGSGSTTPTPSKTDAHYQESFAVTATPATGHYFVGWSSENNDVTVSEGQATLNVASNATLTATFAINHNTITYPTAAEQEAGHFTISDATTEGDYNTTATFTATPNKGYRLVVTAKDENDATVALTHEDFSYGYSFTIPATNVTISVTAYRYGLAYSLENSDFHEEDVIRFDANDKVTLSGLTANTTYKFKLFNEAYTSSSSSHFMGNEGQWKIYESNNNMVPSIGASCFYIYTGVASTDGNYEVTLNDNVNNKPSINVVYPNVSKINIDGNDYTLTQVGETDVYQTETFTLASKLTNYAFNLYWQGARLGNNMPMDDGQHGGKNGHTAWTYESSNRTTPTNLYTTDLANGKYAFKLDVSGDKPKLTAIYPSVIAGGFSGHSWDGEYVLNFSDNVGTATINLAASQSTIAFKVVDDGMFYGKENETLINSKSDIQLTANTSSSYDLKLTPKVAGDYTFTYDKSTHKLSVNYPAQTTYAVDVYLDGASKTTYQVGALDYPITAEVPAGMTFDRWVKEGTIANVSITSETSATTTITATGAGAIVRATFKTENTVYFKDNANWGDVWWYGYDNAYWDENLGTGSKDIAHQNKHATRIGKSDIWFWNYGGLGWTSGIMAFTNKNADNYDKFNFVNVAYFDGTRGKCLFDAKLPLLVIRNYVSAYKNNSQYYLEGVWMKYNSTESGFDLRGQNKAGADGKITWTDVNQHKFTAPTAGGYTFSTTVNLQGGQTYEMRIYDAANRWYTMNGIKMTSTSCTNYKLNFKDNGNFEVETTADGDYTFTISVGGGEMLLTITYPLSKDDYRVVYSEGGDPHSNGYIYKKVEGEKKDTASFYVPGGKGYVKLQYCSDPSSSPIGWADVTGQNINVSSLTAGTYNFEINQNSGSATLTQIGEYKNEYYAVSNALDGGWNGYLGNDNSRMTYSEYSLTHSSYAYNYYITKWVTKNTSAKFNIANKYSKSLSMSDFAGDTIIGVNKETLPQDANVRFMWNSNTNTLQRAYISGSSQVSDRFLVMTGDTLVFDTTGVAFSVTGLEANEQIFTDKGNWVYQIDLRARPTAKASITAKYNNKTATFKDTVTVIGGSVSDTTKYLMRAVYDFKTDKLVTAWRIDNGAIPIGKELTIDAEIMLIRHGQNAAQEITFTGEGELKKVKTIYGAIELQKDEMVNQLSSWTPYAYSVCNYYISFPFDVKISEIFGIGDYGTNWQLQKYDGDNRAKIGWFAETKTFWTSLGKDDELKANTGYLLQLNKNVFNKETGVIWNNVKGDKGKVYIYFPSKTEMGGLSQQDVDVVVEARPCNIDRTFEQDKDKEVKRNHMTTDSHWSMLGIPVFQNNTGKPETFLKGDGPKYVYQWDIEDTSKELGTRTNTMVIAKADGNFTFKAMHGYMAQFHGTITWTGSAPTPASVAARTIEEKKNYEIDLQVLNNSGARVSRTYVELAENASDEFKLNEDVYMAANTTDAAIYSFAGAYDVAANVLSVKNHTIPLGINVKTAGTYSFHMPGNFDGIATLIDHVTSTETILNADDYEVYLDKGVEEGRFELKLEVEKTITTDLNNEDHHNRIFKFIRNEQLYILRDGRIYNATGSVVE